MLSKLPPVASRRRIDRHVRKSARGRSHIAFATKNGTFYLGDVVDALRQKALKAMQGKIQLGITSPRFPLNHKKSYGNLNGKEYLKWITALAPLLPKLIAPDGSKVISIGNA